MRHSPTRRICAVVFALALLTSGAGYITAQTRLKPGMNLFSLRDDVEIGRRSASQIERQYRTYNDPRVSRIGRQLAARSTMPNLPWRFRVVNRADANAFALPGGYIYVTSGMLRRTRNDSELAGILAHEVTHVTLRHGTNQASKAMLAQMPLQILGGRLGGGLVGNLAQLGLSFGLNSLFLKYSRKAETQADVGAVQLMRRAGYEPQGLVSFMQTLGNRGGGFLSDHPSPSNRVGRIQQEIAATRGRGGFSRR
ncbi:MAG TPA: M48 family metallopeptidase [Pyrinomonadaceae bacterium]|nr:M48 family metallopeptidase [Pyrinomonadaceae bacterium]